jgi:hypothetical protein
MDNHHEDTKPSNKWVATPIVLAFLTIAALVSFLSFATGTCCGGQCKDKANTEQHGGEHGVKDSEHGETRDNTQIENNEALKDSTTTDSSATTHDHEGHGNHNESEGHGH